MAQNQLLGAVAFTAQYSRETAEGGRETWDQAVDRVEAMHTRKFPHLADQIKHAFGFVRRQEVFPSQRSMQFGGAAIERNNMRIYNCTFSPCDRTRFFAEAFWRIRQVQQVSMLATRPVCSPGSATAGISSPRSPPQPRTICSRGSHRPMATMVLSKLQMYKSQTLSTSGATHNVHDPQVDGRSRARNHRLL